MCSRALTIGALAEQTGCNVPTIRYYEEIGLLPPARRRPGGHRFYSEDDLRQLTFIRRCRDFGFSVEQVRTLVSLAQDPDRDCNETRDLAQAHLAEVRRKLIELRALESSLEAFVDNCTAACAGGPASQCTITQDLTGPRGSRCCG
ncbi:MerR family transcriptional regulator [Microvirga lupini]|uniref:MerR family transcriptional regulator n=1 Tax=Microvirga lupini TaxID=420324 RepID=UPI00161B98AB|nr:helix-turn-helix domain-containing protein [Microvirga lupini]